MIRTAFLAMLALAALASNAEARQRHRPIVAHPDCNVLFPCEGVTPSPRGERVARAVGFGVAQKVYMPRRSASVVGGRPAHCPARRWCGCYMAVHLGIQSRSLWVARNWARVGHPAGGPGAGVVAVWRHHVGLIKAVDGNRILVLSGNDGQAVRERWRTTTGVIAYRAPS
jgi:hypothetical protein